MKQQTILVTGANKGIGLEIVRQLAQQKHTVLLSARDEKKGKQAVETLYREGLTVAFLQLDVTDEKSIQKAKDTVEKTYGKLDVLINNAGVLTDNTNTLEVKKEIVEEHMTANFYGPLLVSQAFIPLLKKSGEGRIINFSTSMAMLSAPGSGTSAYRLSKVAVNGLTAMMSADLKGTTIKVNSLDPGWVQTDMGGKGAPLSIKEGADTAVWLATSENTGTGKFFRNRKEIAW